MTAPAAGAHTPTITRALEQQLRETLAVLPRQGHPLGPREERRYRLERGLEAIRACEAVGDRLPVAMEVAVRATLDAAREEIAPKPERKYLVVSWRVGGRGFGREHVVKGPVVRFGSERAACGLKVPLLLAMPAIRTHSTLDAPRLCASCVAVARRAR